MADKKNSKFKHVFNDGTPKESEKFRDLAKAVSNVSTTSPLVSCGLKYAAMNCRGAGGPVIYFDINKPGRQVGFCHSSHKGTVLESRWNPFIPNMIATAGKLGTLHILKVDLDAETKVEKLLECGGHHKMIKGISWNRSVANVLASGGDDNYIKVWDVTNGEEMMSYDSIKERLSDCRWNYDGSQLGVTTNSGLVTLFDPRTSKATLQHQMKAKKQSKLFFCGSGNLWGVTGFDGGAGSALKPAIKLWDKRKGEDTPFKVIHMGQSSSALLMPHFDNDTNLLWMYAKGQNSFRMMHIEEEFKNLVKCDNVFRIGSSIKGGCFVPKRALDFRAEKKQNPEIARFLQIEKDNTITAMSFMVPRKQPPYDDLYPECFAGKPAMETEKWMEGENAVPLLSPIDAEGTGIEFVKKMSYQELVEENKMLKAEIEKLKSQLS